MTITTVPAAPGPEEEYLPRIPVKPGIRNGRNVREGYQRAIGIKFGDLAKQVQADALFVDALKHAKGRSLLPLPKLMNLFLLLKMFVPAGDVIEFGSFRGGCAMFMGHICNAINPKTVDRVAAVITPTGSPFVDAGIIGQPPKPGDAGPRIYASGAAAPRVASLRDYGLDIRVLDGALSAASALKMSYAGITKGTQAIGAAMMLAATRAGSADALMAELQLSQKEMLAWLKRQLTMMPPKAYRWVAEMQEIAGFVGDDPAARDLYDGAAKFYEHFAEDFAAGGKEAKALAGFLGKANS